jgi:ATP-binding cassette subfamily B protein
MGIISDKITNIFTILSFATKKRELNEIQNYYDKIQTPLINKANYYNFISWLTLGTLYSATYLVVFLYAIYLRKQGIVSTGVLVVCVLMVLRCCHEVHCLVNNYKSFRNNLAELEASLNGIFIPQNPIDTKNAKALQITKGEIEFKNLCFDYDGDGSGVIKNLNLTIKAGEKIGIVGHSGAGKSTLISLLLKNFKVTSGEILIDGQSIYSVSSDSLRSQIALIPQDTALFHRSIGDNIGYAKDNPSKDEIILAAKMANIHDFIDSLPNKYETLVGERGVKLSGGQRQRIAIARAILKNAPILILDEATSSLDSQTENQIQQALSNLIDAKSKTVIAIAHRLSTLKHLDRIIVLENGTIVEQGKHDDLIQMEKSLYKKLWDSQVDCNLIK